MRHKSNALLVMMLSVAIVTGAVASDRIAVEPHPTTDGPIQLSGAESDFSRARDAGLAELPTSEDSAVLEIGGFAQNMSGYTIDWYSINGGGTVNATSPSYQMSASIGQSVAGASSSSNYQMGIGFWYGAGSSETLCQCNCHGDPNCDGTKVDVTDVVLTVGVAFRNAPAICDPACAPGDCTERTDVNCDGATAIVDVVKMVAVAFRNANPLTEFCDPCAP